MTQMRNHKDGDIVIGKEDAVDPAIIVGIEEIDKQHEELLDRMELLRDYLRRGQSRDAVRDTLKFLESYVVEHFATEVRYMQQYRYPGMAEHKDEHETFLRDFTAFKEKYTAQQARGESTTFLGLEIVRKLNAWFTNHIATTDTSMGAYLAEKMRLKN